MQLLRRSWWWMALSPESVHVENVSRFEICDAKPQIQTPSRRANSGTNVILLLPYLGNELSFLMRSILANVVGFHWTCNLWNVENSSEIWAVINSVIFFELSRHSDIGKRWMGPRGRSVCPRLEKCREEYPGGQKRETRVPFARIISRRRGHAMIDHVVFVLGVKESLPCWHSRLERTEMY